MSMSLSFEMLSIVIILLWLCVLTFFTTRIFIHYNTITKGIKNKNLTSILEELLKEISISQKDIALLKTRCDTIEKDGVFHIQKIGLLRFNPFKDTGGDQSFILALVDGDNTGIVISSLYSRSGARWYAKRIVMGKGVDHELSDEEKNAIKEAKSYREK